MQGGIGKEKIQLLTQAIAAATSSLTVAKQLLSEIERQGGGFSPGTQDVPGLVGKYDGMFMITEAGKKYPVPDNYSAKTKLVYGDKLKMIEGPEGRRFKLLEEAPRADAEAQLAQKDGRFEALGKEGSYKLIQGAVRWWNGAEGDKVKILLPQNEKHPPFAALVEVVGKKPGEGDEGIAPAPVKKTLPVPKVAAPKTEEPAESKEPANRPKADQPRAEPVKKEIPASEKVVEKREEKPAPSPKAAEKKESPKETPAKLSEAKLLPDGKASAVSGKPSKPIDEEELR